MPSAREDLHARTDQKAASHVVIEMQVRVAGDDQVERPRAQVRERLMVEGHDFDVQLRGAFVHGLDEGRDEDERRVVDGADADRLAALKQVRLALVRKERRERAEEIVKPRQNGREVRRRDHLGTVAREELVAEGRARLRKEPRGLRDGKPERRGGPRERSGVLKNDKKSQDSKVDVVVVRGGHGLVLFAVRLRLVGVPHGRECRMQMPQMEYLPVRGRVRKVTGRAEGRHPVSCVRSCGGCLRAPARLQDS